MRLAVRLSTIGLGLGSVMLMAALPLAAQQPGTLKPDSPGSAPPAKRTIDPATRVPTYFGQLALTQEQRESIYQIQSKHQARIDELEKEIRDIREKSVKECETVLTDIQKQLLEQLRRNAAEKGKRVAPKTTKDQPAPAK